MTTNPAEYINSGCKRQLTRELQQAYLSNKVDPSIPSQEG